jgi:VWFA-related protein
MGLGHFTQSYDEHLKPVGARSPISKVAAVGLLLWLSINLAGQEMPTIRVPVRLVTLPTLVLAGDGRVIAGLERSDFRVFDNERLQKTSLDTVSTPGSVAVAVQVSRDVREYTRFIAKVGSTVDALLVGERGQAAVIAYNDDIAVLKEFGAGDVRSALRRISAGGRKARMYDAGVRAIDLLKNRPRGRARILLFIGQPADAGSEHSLDELREQAERENVTIYALTLPIIGKSFASDTFSPRGPNLGRLMPSLARRSVAENGDPFSNLSAETGGTQLHFRKQSELEEGIAIVGVELRSSYVLSYRPGGSEGGYHKVRVEVDVPGARAYTRPGYRWKAE